MGLFSAKCSCMHLLIYSEMVTKHSLHVTEYTGPINEDKRETASLPGDSLQDALRSFLGYNLFWVPTRTNFKLQKRCLIGHTLFFMISLFNFLLSSFLFRSFFFVLLCFLTKPPKLNLKDYF